MILPDRWVPWNLWVLECRSLRDLWDLFHPGCLWGLLHQRRYQFLSVR
jgi:hypothetical protein